MTDLSWRDAIVTVLNETTEPLHYTDIARRVAEQGPRRKLGATPAASVAAELSMSINEEGEKSPFERVSRGVYRLRIQGGTEAAKQQSPETVGEEAEPETGLINAFGMYWKRELVIWSNPKLLGQQQPESTAVNFAEERGVYLLHDRREVVYVGRTTDRALGARLREHTNDRLSGRWDRFSWFGILPVRSDGKLAKDPSETFNVENLIATMEALLIEGLEPPQNRKRGDGFSAVEFIQLVDPEIEKRQEREIAEKLIRSKL
jgi:HB1, ASXL, restriction endonuclease HTH domain